MGPPTAHRTTSQQDMRRREHWRGDEGGRTRARRPTNLAMIQKHGRNARVLLLFHELLFDRDELAALCAAAGKHLCSVLGAHSCAKTVHFCAAAFLWLVCPFRHIYELPRQATAFANACGRVGEFVSVDYQNPQKSSRVRQGWCVQLDSLCTSYPQI